MAVRYYRYRVVCHAATSREFELNYFASTRKDANELVKEKSKQHERVTLLGSPDTAGNDWQWLAERKKRRYVR